MKKFRKYWGWRVDAEATYIERMAHRGQELIAIDSWPRYHFKQVLPLRGTVQLDYQANRELASYQQFLEDAGWQVMATRPQLFGTWVYWYNDDPQAKLYSDQTSKLELLNRLRIRWGIYELLLLVWAAFMFWNVADSFGLVVTSLLVLIVLGATTLNLVGLTQQANHLSRRL
ncbi:MAG TPA: DUF2812 domain-containing protein [Candidatus Levilactobacillus faecigallinarum]|uniref:DUF2812 domain-containing protein n=1 Tax=Candidatus Levilactobacillus faecigallinarum TaxID=2838638 RepID=A0A9D1QS84_9LACO|nr:DUF2812 domain-containing protein [Candidatus Levilactobacillus faecigallinarum]